MSAAEEAEYICHRCGEDLHYDEARGVWTHTACQGIDPWLPTGTPVPAACPERDDYPEIPPPPA